MSTPVYAFSISPAHFSIIPMSFEGKFSSTHKDNCKIFMWNDIFKPNCPLTFYHLVKNILDLVFQIKPKWGHKWKSWTRWWGHCPEECDLANWLSFSGNGDFWTCQQRWPKGRRFSSFPSPFHVLQGRREFCTELTLHFGIQPSPLALYLWLLLGPLTRDPVAVCKLTVDPMLVLIMK